MYRQLRGKDVLVPLVLNTDQQVKVIGLRDVKRRIEKKKKL